MASQGVSSNIEMATQDVSSNIEMATRDVSSNIEMATQDVSSNIEMATQDVSSDIEMATRDVSSDIDMATRDVSSNIEMATQDLSSNIDVFAGDSSGEEFDGFSSDEDEEEDEAASPLDFTGQWEIVQDHDVAPHWLPASPLRKSGPTVAVDPETVSPSELFREFISDDLIDDVVAETNRYAASMKAALGNSRPQARIRSWYNTDRRELAVFFVLMLAMGILKAPHCSDHWTTEWLYETPGFGKVMSRNRFQLLISCLHFADDASADRDANGRHRDPLFKIRKIIDYITAACRTKYYPETWVSVDEQVIGFKGRLSFKQYICNKPTKWGMKAFVLAESSTGYVYDWDLYTGKHHRTDGDGGGSDDLTRGGKVVRNLVKHLSPGHVICMDSYYSSPVLFEELRQRQHGAVGTVRTSRRGLPTALREKMGKTTSTQCFRNGPMLAVAWYDKRQVTLLSTVHAAETVSKRVRDKTAPGGFRTLQRPACADDYNQHVGGVDLCDQLMSYYRFPHRSKRWYLPLFHELMEIVVINARVLFTKIRHQDMSILNFRKQVIAGVLEEMRWEVGEVRRPAALAPTYLRLSGRHFPLKVQGSKRDCISCSDRSVLHGRHQTSYVCMQCNVPLCVDDCFVRFHTLVDHRKVRA